MDPLCKYIEQKNYFSSEVINLYKDLLKPDSNLQINEQFKAMVKLYSKSDNNLNLIFVLIYLHDLSKEFKSELTKIFKSK